MGNPKEAFPGYPPTPETMSEADERAKRRFEQSMDHYGNLEDLAAVRRAREDSEDEVDPVTQAVEDAYDGEK